jgi:hypothetical protein
VVACWLLVLYTSDEVPASAFGLNIWLSGVEPLRRALAHGETLGGVVFSVGAWHHSCLYAPCNLDEMIYFAFSSMTEKDCKRFCYLSEH